ncbi:MAG: ArsR/SmtB family transcription factor [Halanaerobiaceae bacterium]
MSENETPVCGTTIIHQEIVGRVKENLPAEDEIDERADFFKIVGDSTRLKILSALAVAEMCVCDIAALLEMKPSAISHQLRRLKSSGLVKNRKEGKVVYYSLNEKQGKDIMQTAAEFLLSLIH